MKYFSTFSGIGGFELGIQQAYEDYIYRGNRKTKTKDKKTSFQGLEECKQNPQRQRDKSSSNNRQTPICVGYSEIDKYAIQVYQKHFPKHKNYGDITKIKTEELLDFDLLVGGFSCQPYSIAGKRRGLDDLRGQVIYDIFRILRAKKPKIFLLENVKGLISHNNGETIELICEELCNSGYAIDLEILNSKNFGVAQNRERVFIVGKRLDTLPSDMVI